MKGVYFDFRVVDRKGKYQVKKLLKYVLSQDFFEELIEWYKIWREVYKDFMGIGYGYVEVMDKFDGMYR